VTPDLILEWNWRYPESSQYSQPYLIQVTKECYMRITGVEKKNESREKKEKKDKEEEDNSVHQNFMMNSMLQIG